MDRGERLAAIEKMLYRSSGGLRAVEIAAACGVDRRTVYRDLDALEKHGLPITQQDGRFFINRDYYHASVRLHFQETVALFIAARMLARHADQQNPYVVSALSKLGAALPDPLGGHVNFIADLLRGSPVDRNFAQVVETTTRGWFERRKIRLWVSTGKNSEIVTRDFAIYFVEPTSSGGLCAIGQDDLTQKVQTIRLETVKRVKLLDNNYDIPAKFDRRRYLESVWGVLGDGEEKTEVVLAFPADMTSLIKERIWHPSQRIETLADKRCTLSVQVGDWHELLPWIRSWGAQVEVLEPSSLREALAAEASRVLAVYMGARL